ncbi:DNA-binding transcriptional LysR family regulator [Enterococcus sp. PF1-24]|uniref:LysR family transcriptional regulator n=1 Tax=unclassified Enterococcus TaxID=2608891 RepID=UPI0024761FFA|nr:MULTISPECIES: LysR family transcriptional regulator [unclassified Enterococcus]MDH6363912.1 DNA-binding transcriptional LysR family regulator [Enterococcus sp. PFB1-1]MDH6400902.1 DNA-binding transcriptional LysR family regulator [Enterococcus sp. PF1-24]
MKIEHLQSFVTLANTLNYTKAAETLFITQPTLSRHIKNLESELNCQLFIRNTRQVQLTNQGNLFLKYATNMIFDYKRGLQKLDTFTEKVNQPLKISFLRGGSEAYLLPILQKFTEKYPQVPLKLYDGNHDELLKELEAQHHDLCLTMISTLTGANDLKLLPFSQLKTVLVVPDSHPLAVKQTVTFNDFTEEPYLCVKKQLTKAWYDFVLSLYLSNGHYPVIASTCQSVTTLLMQVSLGKGITVLTEGCRSAAPKNLKLIPIENAQPSQMIFGYQKDNQNPNLKLFIDWFSQQPMLTDYPKHTV